ncbi:MAG: LD-carboxypeptidase, partial [Bacteroidia bacterium]|nr:LD-carboxypeptidase [Bacteroidia bacterium]
MKIVKPKKLVKGDLIGLISPASPVKNREIIDDAVNYIEKQGYKVILGEHIYSEKGYFAGSDQQRLDDLHKMFTHKDVKAIFCLRGGYGTG